jgi:hypothetical protein
MATTKDSSFTDQVKDDGVTKFYKVTAVDKFGLESPIQKTPVLGSSKPKPNKPIILSTSCSSGVGCNIKWFSDKGTSFFIRKTKYLNPIQMEDTIIKNINSKEIQDKLVEPNTKYKYYITAIDKDGVNSDESEPSEVYIETKR